MSSSDCYGKPNIVRPDPEGAFRDQGSRRGLAAKSIRLDIDFGAASWKTGVLGKTLDTIKQSATRAPQRTPDSVTIQEIFHESATAHNDQHRTRGFSPWQLLLGKAPTDESVFENPDLAQYNVEVMDQAVKQRLRVKEESYKAHIEGELSLRKRRREIHQARPWRQHWAASEWCWCWRSNKHKGSRMKGGVFLGLARVLLQARETTAEGVSMKCCGSLCDVLYSTCVPFLSPKKDCAVSQTQKPSVSKTLLDVCHTTMLGKKRHWLGPTEHTRSKQWLFFLVTTTCGNITSWTSLPATKSTCES